jgi:hypothetical protein
MSASCSSEPDSRRSLIAGFSTARCSGPRFSCHSAITGTYPCACTSTAVSTRASSREPPDTSRRPRSPRLLHSRVSASRADPTTYTAPPSGGHPTHVTRGLGVVSRAKKLSHGTVVGMRTLGANGRQGGQIQGPADRSSIQRTAHPREPRRS